MILLCLMAILLISGCSRSGTTWQVIGGSVYDGDTFRATNGRATIKVRLCGIDAPEKQQRLGIAAREHLRSMLAEGEVRLISAAQDRYGRLVAEAFTPKGQFINAEMVRSGGWHGTMQPTQIAAPISGRSFKLKVRQNLPDGAFWVCQLVCVSSVIVKSGTSPRILLQTDLTLLSNHELASSICWKCC